MKIQLSQREISQLIVNYLVRSNIVKSKLVSVEYEMSTGTSGNELIVFVEEK